ncbi:MAG: sialidase family protein [Burkholderiaceae bacterium]
MNRFRRFRYLFSCLLLCWLGAMQPAFAQHHHHGPALGTGLAVAPDGALWMVGLDRDAHLFVQSSRDHGKTWTEPRLVDNGSDKVSAEGENRPKIAFGPHCWAVISYTQPLPKPYTGEIRMLRSDDGGKTFSAPFTVHRDRQLITHRFDSILFDAHGVLHTLWVDKRDAAQHPDQSYRGAAIYRNFSTDGGKTFSPDLRVAEHTCECCRIALVQGPDGGAAAMWRHVFEPNIRDHAFARLPADESPVAFTRATFDDWKVDACPHHGPGLAYAGSGVFHAVWYGIRNGEPGVRYESLDADGKPAGQAVLIPDPMAQHADVLADGDKVAIAWESFDGKSNRLKAWVSHDGGKHFELRELAHVDGSTDEPRMIRQGNRMLVAWRTEKGVNVYEL